MTQLIREMSNTAQRLGIPLGVQLDLTYRCNERCVHCYLDHDDHGEMSTAEIKGLLDQMAESGVFFLTISGGEILMRRDFFEIAQHARSLMFCLKLTASRLWLRSRFRSACTRIVQRCMTRSANYRVRSGDRWRGQDFWWSAGSR
jgi:MoaA/NifB/PqqE/SkfB family radical SAM enzyme